MQKHLSLGGICFNINQSSVCPLPQLFCLHHHRDIQHGFKTDQARFEPVRLGNYRLPIRLRELPA